MKVLYYIEPVILMDAPRFNLEWLRIAVKTLEAFSDNRSEFEAVILHGEALDPEVVFQERPAWVRFVSISQGELRKICPDWYSFFNLAENEYLQRWSQYDFHEYEQLIKAKLGNFAPDFIMSFSSQANLLRKTFPGLPVYVQEQGLFSGSPFLSTWFLDPRGHYKYSFLREYSRELVSGPLSDEERFQLQRLRNHLQDLYDGTFESGSFLSSYRQKYKALVLLPLQVSRHISTDTVSGFHSQFEILEYVMNSVSEDIGVLVTEYNAWGSILDSEGPHRSLEYFEKKYPHFISPQILRQTRNPSQYLVPKVDAVIAVSSNVGLQALFWNKPLFCIGESHLSGFSCGSVEELGTYVMKGQTPSYDAAVAWLLQRYYYSEGDLHRPQWLEQRMGDLRAVVESRDLQANVQTQKSIEQWHAELGPIPPKEKLVFQTESERQVSSLKVGLDELKRYAADLESKAHAWSEEILHKNHDLQTLHQDKALLADQIRSLHQDKTMFAEAMQGLHHDKAVLTETIQGLQREKEMFSGLIEERDRALKEQNGCMNQLIKQLQDTEHRAQQRVQQINELLKQIQESDLRAKQQFSQLVNLTEMLNVSNRESAQQLETIHHLRLELLNFQNSTFWKLTRPLRDFVDWVRMKRIPFRS